MKSKQFWTKELNTWVLPLKDIVRDPYMEKIMTFLSIQYTLNNVIPIQDFVFRYFKNSNYGNIHTVITVPCISHLTNIGRITFDNQIYDYEYGPLQVVSNQIEKLYCNNLLLDFDFTLLNWSKQGILILPQSLTYGKDGVSHQIQWNKFFLYILQKLDDYKQDLVFLQWGTDIKITKHHSLRWESPYQAFKENRNWLFPFEKVDEKLLKLYNIKIKWY